MPVFGRQMKVPLGVNCAVGGDGVDVGVKMDQFAKGLDAGNHGGHDVLPLEDMAVDLDHGFPGGVRHFAEQTAVVAAVDPQPLGDGEDNGTRRPAIELRNQSFGVPTLF